jgi:hypothetical protein
MISTRTKDNDQRECSLNKSVATAATRIILLQLDKFELSKRLENVL